MQDFVSHEASQECLHDILGNACIETFTYFQQPDFVKTESLILYLQRGNSFGDCVCACTHMCSHTCAREGGIEQVSAS